jgi:hypothetical protein
MHTRKVAVKYDVYISQLKQRINFTCIHTLYPCHAITWTHISMCARMPMGLCCCRVFFHERENVWKIVYGNFFMALSVHINGRQKLMLRNFLYFVLLLPSLSFFPLLKLKIGLMENTRKKRERERNWVSGRERKKKKLDIRKRANRIKST